WAAAGARPRRRPAMREAWLLACAMLSSLCGMGWLALAMDVHWGRVRGDAAGPGARRAIALRTLAAAAIAGALGLCLAADHASIAVLVWLMSLVVSVLLVAFALASRPRWLTWLTWGS
ncbi:MAG: DUF3325 family protein, partial [Burkholderiaceae bacterium]